MTTITSRRWAVRGGAAAGEPDRKEGPSIKDVRRNLGIMDPFGTVLGTKFTHPPLLYLYLYGQPQRGRT